MKRFNRNMVIGFLVVISAFTLFSCSEDSERGMKYARLEVRLTDAPGDYEEVNVDIKSAQVRIDDGQNESGWITLDVNEGVYNLLTLTNGNDTLLAAGDLPPGKISQIRLVLGTNNSLKINGKSIPLKTPSAQQSGLKVKVDAELTEGITYTLLLDFDAARSVVKAGNSGNFILKPVLRGIIDAKSGAIAGSISDAAAKPAVYAIQGLDTLGTSFANETGKFMIKGLPAGSYTVSFDPAEGFSIDDLTGVAVNLGQVTDVGTVAVNKD